jgi:hypothetical protein
LIRRIQITANRPQIAIATMVRIRFIYCPPFA